MEIENIEQGTELEQENQEQEIQMQPEMYRSGGAVNSVNGMTGDVVLTTSDLENTANFQNANDVANAISTHNQSTSAHQDIRQAISDEATARYNADNNLQGQIDAITSASDVVDIVGTYAELQAYDTQHLKDNDVIKVLQDETHNDAMTYYRWSTDTSTWTYVGAEGPYYTKSETNTLLDAKLDANEVPDGFFDGPATITPTSSTSVEIEGGLKLKTVQLLGNSTQQTYSGKNLIPYNTADLTSSRTANMPNLVLPSGSYTISFELDSFELGTNTTFNLNMQLCNSSGTVLADPAIVTINNSTQLGRKTAQFTISEQVGPYNNTNIRIPVTPWNNGARASLSNIQIEAGSTATDFEPYVGGTASPNPSYPQTVNVVTGTQTITVTDGDNATDTYTVNLGAIELCKIGDYQDYIYKSGDDWYVHKTVGKAILNGTESWEALSQYSSFFTYPNPDAMIMPSRLIGAISNNFSPEISTTSATQWGDYHNNCIALRGRTTTSQIGIKTDVAVNTDAFKTWLSNHNTTVYYVLATPTDTQITDSSLISQLNAVLNATLYQPNTTITSSGNLPAILKLEVYTEHLNSLLEIASEPMPTPVTYSDFVGTDGVTAGTAGLVPAPAVTDVDKFLKSDGTWDTAGGGSSVTVVQTTGTSQTDVMSQNAVSSMVFADPATKQKVQIGVSSAATGGSSVAIGRDSKAEATSATAVGRNADAKHQSGTAIGYYTKAVGEGSTAIGDDAVAGSATFTQGATAIGTHTTAAAKGSVAIGAYALLDNSTSDIGKVQFGTTNTSYGYNSTNYRLLTGVHDPVGAHDAATKGYVDSAAGPFHTITSDDFNYDSDGDSTNDSVALWLLPTGFYLFPDTPEFQLWAYIDEDDNPVDVTMGIYIIQNNGPGDVVSIALVGAERMEPIVVDYDTGTIA